MDALLLAGDIFDNGVADVTSRVALVSELRRLSRAGIATVMIRGNHDALLDHTRYGPLEEGVVLLDAARPTCHVGDAAIHGLGFESRHVATSLLPRYPAAEAGAINVGLMHTSLGGAEGHDLYAPCSEPDLLAHGYDYWALGHIHKRFERRSETALAVMPGIPQGRHAREPGRGSATLVQIDDGGARVREVALAAVAFEAVDVGRPAVEPPRERQELIKGACGGASRRRGRGAAQDPRGGDAGRRGGARPAAGRGGLRGGGRRPGRGGASRRRARARDAGRGRRACDADARGRRLAGLPRRGAGVPRRLARDVAGRGGRAPDPDD